LILIFNYKIFKNIKIDYNEFYYNFIENVLNTNDPINYDVIEREANHTISQFKELFDKEIIDGK